MDEYFFATMAPCVANTLSDFAGNRHLRARRKDARRDSFKIRLCEPVYQEVKLTGRWCSSNLIGGGIGGMIMQCLCDLLRIASLVNGFAIFVRDRVDSKC